MTSWWDLSNGQKATGNESDAFISQMGIIPDGTQTTAKIQKFTIEPGQGKPFINIQWKLVEGDFHNRVVFQKLHCWDDKPQKADRSKNMLLLIMKLCNHQPVTGSEPTDKDFAPMLGKTCGIKIAEWSMIKPDGTLGQGNFVSEVHDAKGYEVLSGKKLEVVGYPSPVDSAFSRNPRTTDTSLEADVPF